uniref:Uncharacterized protein n=1 Tax=Oryza nivara TaxID=4536 RepID=A0A0E0GGH8_ORYNI
MTSADNEVVDARTAMKTKKVAKLRSERATQLQLHVDAALIGDVAMLRRAPLSIATTSGGVDHRQRHYGPRGAT